MASRARAIDRRTQLLSAARTVFAKKGYEDATVSEIVQRAGVAQGTFYLYFPGKESLAGAFAELISERFAELAAEKTTRSRSFESALVRLFEAAYQVADENRDIFLIGNRGLELVDDLDEWMNRTAPAREWLEQFVRHWQAEGAVDPRIRPATTARVLRDALDRAAKAFIVFGDRNYGRDLAELLRRGLAPSHAA
ncbi:MAG TPA: TetR family transcriptional regulator [Thermoleophilaceae bacterium]|jgi:AcrR family transcriptional regulator|nr:TetR family transcriptional regulator [Thermoleophilaceae bacterium]